MNSFSYHQNAYPSPIITPTTPRVLPIQPERGLEPRNLLAHFKNGFAVRKRHRKILRDNLPAALSKSTLTFSRGSFVAMEYLNNKSGPDKPTIRRLARRGGVKRIKSEIYQTVQEIIKKRIAEVCTHITSQHSTTSNTRLTHSADTLISAQSLWLQTNSPHRSSNQQ